jgi:hypothetical protein
MLFSSYLCSEVLHVSPLGATGRGSPPTLPCNSQKVSTQ